MRDILILPMETLASLVKQDAQDNAEVLMVLATLVLMEKD
jgi:hypothetical protein